MTAYIFDTETTGMNEPEIIEAAWVGLTDTSVITEAYCERFRPSKPIQLGALATHHIMDEDLVDCRPSTEFRLPADMQYMIGHNVDYDWKVAGEPDVKRICTLALSRHLWPEADSHTQSAMLYLLERERARHLLRNAHAAEDDVRNCWLLLGHIVARLGGVADFEALWEASERARIPTHMTFGKHKGMAITDVPADYKNWLLRQPDVDPYLEMALRGKTTP